MKAVVLALGLLIATINAASINTVCNGCTFGQGIYLLAPTPSNTLAMMANGNLWRSTDSGKTWSNVFSGGTRMIPTYSNSSLIYFTGFGNNLNYTTDAGVTFQSSTAPLTNSHFYAQDFYPHPTKDGWVMLNAWQGTGSVEMGKCTMYITKDYGKTWNAYFENIVKDRSARWGNTTAQPDLVFFQHTDLSYGYSTNYKTFNKLFDTVDLTATRMTRHYQFISVSAPDAFESELYVSSNRLDAAHTNRNLYRVAEFPFGDEIAPNTFYYLDDITSSEFIGVHQARGEGWISIFSSGPNGASYRMSIDEVFSTSAGVDFDRFRGMQGIFLVNTIRSRQAYYFPGNTKITFDNGGSWHHLAVPATDMNGNPWACTSNCRFNIAGPASNVGVPPWHTSTEAIGMIIANGNVASSISDSSVPLSTFYSRDSGATWKQILPVPTFAAFGNRGSIIVAAPKGTQNYMWYSLNEGVNFTQIQIVNTGSIYYTGVYAHPNSTGYVFLVTGSINNVPSVWVLDLTDVQPDACGASDFENYIPQDPFDSTNCFMGAITIYNRRKLASKCFIPPGVEVVASQTACACQWEDYECAFNYDSSSRNDTNGFTCTKNSPDRECIPGQTYNKPTGTGYTLIPDTMCTGGLNLLGPSAVCPGGNVNGDGKKGGSGGTVAAVIIVLLVVGVVAAFVAYKKVDKFHDWVESIRGNSNAHYGKVSNDDVEGLLN